MKVVPKAPAGHALGWCIFRRTGAGNGRTSGTGVSFFVRADFRLPSSGPAVLDVSGPVVPAGDTPHDDPGHGLRYPSDFVPRKPFGEVIVAGTAHPPAGQTVTRYRVGVAVGGWRKELDVHGERGWNTGGFLDQPAAAGPAGPVPLSFARAWGGPGVADNPLGFGLRGDRVPNLEHPARPITARRTNGDPAGLGPIPPDWPQRRRHAGMPGTTGAASWWPWTPPGFDERFWMATLPDQWVEGHFRGDEAVELSHLHPERTTWRTALPGQRARCFLLRLPQATPLRPARPGRLADLDAAFDEVPLVLDTVFIDTDAARLTLVWRGSTAVRSPKLLDVPGVVFGLEPLGEDRDPGVYLDQLLAEGNLVGAPVPDRASILAAIERTIAEREAAQAAVAAQMEAQLAKVRADVGAELATARVGHEQAVEGLATAFGPDREAEIRAACQFLPGDPFADGPPPAGPSMGDVAANLRQRAEAMLEPPADCPEPLRESFMEAARSQAQVLRDSAGGLDEAAAMQAGIGGEIEAFKSTICAGIPADLLVERVLLPGTPLDLEAIRRDGLDRYDLRGVDFSGLDLGGVSFRGAHAAQATFRGTRLAAADFTQANLTGVDLSDADLSGAILEQADLTDAVTERAVWRDTRLTGARLAGLSLHGADFSGSSGSHADFSRADLSTAGFREARLDRPCFREACLDAADFSAAELRQADFGTTSCRGAIFDDAALPNLRAREAADFSAARLHRVRADDASWTTSLLDHADFQDADLRRVDFSECSLEAVNFDRCDLANATFADSVIRSARLTDANLLRACFDRAVVADVRFDGSSLFEAGFWETSLTGATFAGCDVGRASLPSTTGS